MKKKATLIIFLLLLFVAGIHELSAQNRTPIRSGKISFLNNKRYSLYIPGREDTTDSGFLYFNDTASSYYVSQKMPTYDEILKQGPDKPSYKESIPAFLSLIEEKLKRNFYFHKAGTATMSSPWRTPSGDKWYCILDTIPSFTWELLPDTIRILGFLCQKASFRSSAYGNAERSYTAWFAPDLAYAYGPFRFFGLPGMILELNNTYFSYKAVSIDLPLPEQGIFPITCCSGLPAISKKQSDQMRNKARTDLDNMIKVQSDKN